MSTNCIGIEALAKRINSCCNAIVWLANSENPAAGAFHERVRNVRPILESRAFQNQGQYGGRDDGADDRRQRKFRLDCLYCFVFEAPRAFGLTLSPN